jgi:acetyltransferase-like isoleucine patch superfamily enzyme
MAMSSFLKTLVGSAKQALRSIHWKLLAFTSFDYRVRTIRKIGVRIGENCDLHSYDFSTEPYLVELGNHVAVSSDVHFITHDATGWLFEEHPTMDVYGRITVGDHVFFGTHCVVLPGTTIGSNCVIGAGTVVRGVIPDGSVVLGNPGEIVMKTSLLKQILVHHKNRLETRNLPPEAKERAVRRHFGLD